MLARPTLPDDVAYRLARALHKGEAAIATRLAQARESTAANTVAAAPRADLIHPGVRALPARDRTAAMTRARCCAGY